jgi:signal recognition particle receptor subunit beta
MRQLGLRWPTKISFNVGAILPRSQRDRVSGVDPLKCGHPFIVAFSFIVDSADKAAFPTAKEELHFLLEKPSMEGIPLLVLGNKSDLPNHAATDEIIEALNLNSITHREVSCYGISAKEETNLDAVLRWLIARGQK